MGIVSQYALRRCEIGNGVQDEIMLRGQSGALRIVPHSDGKEREVIREDLEKITGCRLFSTLSDMGDVLWSDTTLDVYKRQI